MVDFKEFVSRFSNLEDFLKKESNKILLRHNNEIVELSNKQLLKGLNADGETMQKGYSTQYGKKRKKSGLQTSFVDLKFTGKYQDSRKLVEYKYGVDIRSEADYEPHLRANFPNHTGLTKESAEVVAESTSTELCKLIETYLTK